MLSITFILYLTDFLTQDSDMEESDEEEEEEEESTAPAPPPPKEGTPMPPPPLPPQLGEVQIRKDYDPKSKFKSQRGSLIYSCHHQAGPPISYPKH